jgi:hypothetical protein
MSLFFGLSYFIGGLVAATIIRSRAGVGQGRIKILGPNGFGLDWFLACMVATMFWPITLVIWLTRGRPEPRIVFNEKARERRRSLQA